MTDTIIEFIGLFMFTVLSGTSHVTAIAPQATLGVQAHTTIIMYKADGRNHVSGWTEETVESGHWKFVRLAPTEQIEILSDATNPALTALSSLAVPKVGGVLQATYKGPPYARANAVVTIRNGTLAACSSGERIDTNLTLSVGTTLTIKSLTAGTRKIELPAGNPVAIVNVPLALATKPSTYTPSGANHSSVYCVMTGQARSCVMVPASSAPAACSSAIVVPEIMKLHGMALHGTDFACSNTQWP